MGDLDKIVSLVAGKGLLDLRAYIASVVGPRRLPMGSKQTFSLLTTNEPTQIATNIGVADAIVLVGVVAESGQEDSGVAGLLGREAELGANSWPVLFLPFGNQDPNIALLLPGDQLFAKATGADVRIVVSQVTFR